MSRLRTLCFSQSGYRLAVSAALVLLGLVGAFAEQPTAAKSANATAGQNAAANLDFGKLPAWEEPAYSATPSDGTNPAEAKAAASMKPDFLERVFFISGGTTDDFVSATLLLTFPSVRPIGMEISNTDCIYSYAMQAQWKIFSFLQRPDFLFGLSKARGLNAFPWSYRNDSYLVWKSEVLREYRDKAEWPPFPSGDEMLRRALKEAVLTNRPITVLITEPLTPLSDVLRENPLYAAGVKRIIWMGGAINAPGNLDPTTIPPEIANGLAEWNVFWDPYAVDWIFKNTTFPIVLFPLDVTDQAKLTDSFMNGLKAQSSAYNYSRLVYNIYGLVQGQPYFEMWNTLTTAYLGNPDLFEDPVSMRLKVVTEGYEQGAIIQGSRGRLVDVVFNIKDPNAFYTYVLNQLKRN